MDSLQVVGKKFGSNFSIVVEDFNTILINLEKKGGNMVHDPMRERMEDLISNWDLSDVKPAKGKYTWSNKRVNSSFIAAHLDRFLIHSDF